MTGMKKRFGTRNLLMRRVSRHANATALFRQFKGEAGGMAALSPWTAESMGSAIGQAFILPQESRWEAMPQLDESVVKAPVETGREVVKQKPMPVEPAVPRITSPVRSSESNSDPVWRRLETIFRRHQEVEGKQEAAAEETLAAQAGSPVSEGREAGEEGEILRESRSSMEGKSEKAGRLPSAVETGQRRGMLLEEGELPARREGQLPLQKRESESATYAIEESTTLPLQVKQSAGEKTEVKRGVTGEEIVGRQIGNVQSGLEEKEGTPQKNVSAAGEAGEIAVVAKPENPARVLSHVEEGSESPGIGGVEPGEQVVPLQAAWPVQMQAEKSGMVTADRMGDKPTVLMSDHALQTSHQEVKQILQTIAPADQTDSSVELITPRQAKPAVVARKPPPVQGEQVKPGEGKTTPAKATKRTPEPDEREKEYPEQRASGEVVTEIGALPGELWILIDEPIPEVALSPEVERETDKLHASIEAAPPGELQKQSEPEAWPVEPIRASKPVVQRKESEAEEAPAFSSGEKDLTGIKDEQIEDLARRVYNEVRRKLQVEWERFRH